MDEREIEERFAPLTRSVSELLKTATLAAEALWAYLRQEHHPELPFNISLQDAAETQSGQKNSDRLQETSKKAGC